MENNLSPLTPKEAAVLDGISRKSSISQRELSKATGISLGLINVILRRFVKAGYISVANLNKRKLNYLLTPQGLVEAARRSYEFAANTIKNYNLLQSRLAKILGDLHQTGYDYFSIHGDGELKALLEVVFRRCLEDAPVSLGKEHRGHPRAVVLSIVPEPPQEPFRGDVVNVLEKLGIYR